MAGAHGHGLFDVRECVYWRVGQAHEPAWFSRLRRLDWAVPVRTKASRLARVGSVTCDDAL